MIIACAQCGTKNRVNPTAAQLQRPVCGKCGSLLDLSRAVADDGGKTVTVTDANFAQEVVAASKTKPVLVDAWAEWCGPCRIIGPTLDQLAKESSGRFRIAKLNVDENPATSASFQIRSIPTLLLFKNGQLVDRIVGVQPKQTIADQIAKFM
jgi:thioredoxin